MFGQKKLRVYDNVPTSPACASDTSSFNLLSDFGEFSDLVWDARFVLVDEAAVDAKHGGNSSATSARSGNVVVGFAHNFVQLWSWSAGTAAGSRSSAGAAGKTALLHHVQCEVQCLLYCFSFQQGAVQESSLACMTVASGTVFNQVHTIRKKTILGFSTVICLFMPKSNEQK